MTPTTVRQQEERPLFFVLQFRHRPVKVLDGLPDPGFWLWEARAIPSLEYALGETKEEAQKNLMDLIDAEVAASGLSDEAWYVREIERLPDEALRGLHQAALQALRNRQEPNIDIANSPAITFDEIEETKGEEACHGAG